MARPRVAPLELLCYRGEDYVLKATHHVSGAPDAARIDPATWTIKGRVKAQGNDEVVMEATATFPADDAIDYQLVFPSASTAALDAGVYDVDIQRTNAGAKTEMGKGTFTVKEPVGDFS